MVRSTDRAVGVWLLVCCFLVFAMVVLGGVTRLTGSGLSMVRWAPLSGAIPPITAAAWEAEFNHYQQSPEFQKVNHQMTVNEFKTIFYVEYFHRLLGRAIGLVFLVPFLVFLWRGRIRRALIPKLSLVFVLGGLQGLLGWYMVKSGLVDVPRVSPYRLTAHLIVAVAIYAYLFWTALGLMSERSHRSTVSPLSRGAIGITAMIVVTILSGGFVAGLKAGHAFNTFPLMAGQWIPPGYRVAEPFWLNFFETIPAVQFNHRWLAITTFVLVLLFALRAWRDDALRTYRAAVAVLAMLAVIQVSLGISTLVLHVPVVLAAAHQGAALALLTAALYVVFIMRHLAGAESGSSVAGGHT
jgi:cytochrome c oxidase assembly protein subunit 15